MFLSTGMGRRICLLRSSIKGDHSFPDVIMALQFYLVASPGVRGNLPVFTTTRTGMYSNLPVPVHGNGVSLGLYHTGRGGRVNHALQSFFINDIIYCISSVGKLSILKFRTERAPKSYPLLSFVILKKIIIS